MDPPPVRQRRAQARREVLSHECVDKFLVSTLDDLRSHGHILTPGRHIGPEEAEDDGPPFDQKMKRLTAKPVEGFGQSAWLAKANVKGNDEYSHPFTATECGDSDAAVE